MLRRILVIVAAVTILWTGSSGAQLPEGAAGKDASETSAAPGRASIDPPVKDAVRPPPSHTDEAVQAAASASIRVLGLQTEFPRRVEPLQILVPEWVIWAALICVAALIAYVLRDSLPSWLRGAQEGWEVAPAGSENGARAGETDALAAADQLGRDGRFVEAMHMLLLQSLADIRRRLGEQFADSLTSREILRGARLSPQERTSLRDIVAAVERTYFGGHPAEPADYEACRRSFDALQSALRGSAPA
jgi:Domain of unknown function (DUF4129)